MLATANKLVGYVISLSVANINIQVILRSPSLSAALERLYRDYPAVQSPHLTISIELSGMVSEPGDYNPVPAIDKAFISFHSGKCQGTLDLDKGEGKITIHSKHPMEEIDYLLRIVLAVMGFRAGGILIHAAGIVHRGSAHVFMGHSGSGKSTISRASLSDIILNDDLVLLMPDENRWVVYSTPFSNISQVQPTALNAPMAGLYHLVKGERPHLETISPAQALAELVSCVPVIAGSPAYISPLMERCDSILASAPVFDLHFTPDSSFWEVIDKANKTNSIQTI